MAWWPFGAKEKAPAPSPGLISPIQNLHREYPEDTITPVRFKLILKNADIGLTSELMELLDAAASDYKVGSVLRTRKLSVASAPWTVKPAIEKDEASQRDADEAKAFLSFPQFTQMKMDLQDAHYRGFACGRLLHDMALSDDGTSPVERLAGWEPIESRFFTFKDAHEPLVTTEGNPEGVPLPPEYIFYVVRDKPGPVTRGGTGRGIARMWLYKGYFAIDMAGYIEKYGQPHVNVTIPAHYVEGSAELERAKDAARSLIADHIGLVPEGVVLELLESIKQTSTVKDTYLAAIQFCDEAIAMAELGHTLSSAGSSVGGLGHGGEAKQAGDVKQEIRAYDAEGLADLINEQVLWPWWLRTKGDKAKPPRFCIEVEEAEDELEKANALKLRADTIAVLQSAGLEISIEQVREEFDLRPPQGEDDTLAAPEPEPVDEDEDDADEEEDAN